jgi:hypothetical protein
MAGVFSETPTENETPTTDNSIESSGLFQEAPPQVDPVPFPLRLDLKTVTKETELKSGEISQILTGNAEQSFASKALADGVLFDLSDEDRDLLEKINKN